MSGGKDRYRPLSRRTVLRGGVAGLVVGGAGGATWWSGRRHDQPPLYAESVALTSPTSRELVQAGRADLILPGSRVMRSAPQAAALRSDQQRWLSSSAAWTRGLGGFDDLARSALLDLHVLTSGVTGGATVAGWSPRWRYVWPRDASATASALAVAGHPSEAVATLGYLQRVQRADGWFEARYLPGTDEAPDDRARQLDGSGWVVWATEQVRRSLTPPAGLELVRSMRTMLKRSVGRILISTNTPDFLPAPSPDYWEVDTDELTLGTVAPLLAGLGVAPGLLTAIGETELAAAAADRHDELAEAVSKAFGAHGWPREKGGDDQDAAIAFALPPFARTAPAGATDALAHAARRMIRPAGGLAPGAGWKDDGISWTPETAAFALASAATGDRAAAQSRLRWLAEHRTSAGSFPEKVLADGSPAAVAPLSWTAALVLLTLHQLHS
ncbi:glycoside hydrolase family 15 [Luteipulveratus sp. YIM 133132]|uniref:glycoside hydrolase family 15 n=1 Tax=Luteipulveratus flavus TaxID=3031728 RepID=UPI0023B069EF|nr:glycoside hydrolase family 15 [Luteipulveratus sp. YIM 133132]MDE9366567.1 glycoside hydrolase family 15 [Luteipulveratus sp. YIM 133132]